MKKSDVSIFQKENSVQFCKFDKYVLYQNLHLLWIYKKLYRYYLSRIEELLAYYNILVYYNYRFMLKIGPIIVSQSCFKQRLKNILSNTLDSMKQNIGEHYWSFLVEVPSQATPS